MKKFYNDDSFALPIRLTSQEADAYNFVYFDMVQSHEAVRCFLDSTTHEDRMTVYRTANRVKNRLERRVGRKRTLLHMLTPVK